MTRLTSSTATPFRGSLAVARGDVTWDRLARREFVKLRPDIYVGADVPVDVPIRVEALGLWAGPGSVVAGPLAALIHRVDCPWDDEEVVLPGRHRCDPGGATVRQDLLPPDEIARWGRTWITTPQRTAFDLAARAPFADAVAAADALGHGCQVRARDLEALAASHPRVRGLVQIRRVIASMDPRAESLPESRLRVGLVQR